MALQIKSPPRERHGKDRKRNENKLCHGSGTASIAIHHCLFFKLDFHQLGMIIIPKRHSARSKRGRHLGFFIHPEIRPLTGVVFLERNTADWLRRWIAELGKVCVHFHDEQTDVFVRLVRKQIRKTRHKRDSKIKEGIVAMLYPVPRLVKGAYLLLIIEHAHVNIGIHTVNIGDCVTWGDEIVITDEISELGSQRIFIAAVGPWSIHKLQSIPY